MRVCRHKREKKRPPLDIEKKVKPEKSNSSCPLLLPLVTLRHYIGPNFPVSGGTAVYILILALSNTKEKKGGRTQKFYFAFFPLLIATNTETTLIRALRYPIKSQLQTHAYTLDIIT